MKNGIQAPQKSNNSYFKLRAPKIAKDRNCDHLIDKKESDFRKTISDMTNGFPFIANVRHHLQQ